VRKQEWSAYNQGHNEMAPNGVDWVVPPESSVDDLFAAKSGPDAVLLLHFSVRARYFQEKNKTIGPISERISAKKCIISGKQLTDSTSVVHPDHKNPELDELFRKLNSTETWNAFMEHHIPNFDEIPVKILQNGSDDFEDKHKFCYLTKSQIERDTKLPKWIQKIFSSPINM